MKIKKRFLIYRIALYCVIFFWMHGLYLLRYPSFLSVISGQEAYRYFLSILSVLMFVSVVLMYRSHIKKIGGLINYFYLYAFSYACLFLYSIIIYDRQSVISTLHVGGPFLIPLLVPVFLIIWIDDRANFDKILKYVDLITFLWSVVLIFQSLYFKSHHTFAFDFMNYFTTGVTFRDDSVRLSLGAVANMMMVYRMYVFFYEERHGVRHIYNFISICTSLYALIVIQQTRMYTFTMAVVFLVLLFCSGKSNRIKLISAIIVGVASYILLTNNIVSNFIESFALNSDKGVSTLARINEIGYYGSCFLKNPIFGNGFASDVEYPYIEHGVMGSLYYVDVGIIGLLAQIGICGVIFYVVPLIRMVQTTVSSIKYTKNWQIDVGLTTYMLLTSGTLLQIHPVQVLAFVLVFAYFEYRRYRLSESNRMWR